MGGGTAMIYIRGWFFIALAAAVVSVAEDVGESSRCESSSWPSHSPRHLGRRTLPGPDD